jgi:hypothetical protein
MRVFLLLTLLLSSLPALAQFPYAGPEDETALFRLVSRGNDTSYSAVNTAGSDMRLGFTRSVFRQTLLGSGDLEVLKRYYKQYDVALRSDENVAAVGLNYRPGLDAQYSYALIRRDANYSNKLSATRGLYMRVGGVMQQYLFSIPEPGTAYDLQRMRYSSMLAATVGGYIVKESSPTGQVYSLGFALQGGWLHNSFEGLEQVIYADSFALSRGGNYARLYTENPVWLGSPERNRVFIKPRIDFSLPLFSVGKAPKSTGKPPRLRYNKYTLGLILSAEARVVSGLPLLFSGAAGISFTRYNRPVLAVLYRHSGKNYGFKLPTDGIHFSTAFSFGS